METKMDLIKGMILNHNADIDFIKVESKVFWGNILKYEAFLRRFKNAVIITDSTALPVEMLIERYNTLSHFHIVNYRGNHIFFDDSPISNKSITALVDDLFVEADEYFKPKSKPCEICLETFPQFTICKLCGQKMCLNCQTKSRAKCPFCRHQEDYVIATTSTHRINTDN